MWSLFLALAAYKDTSETRLEIASALVFKRAAEQWATRWTPQRCQNTPKRSANAHPCRRVPRLAGESKGSARS